MPSLGLVGRRARQAELLHQGLAVVLPAPFGFRQLTRGLWLRDAHDRLDRAVLGAYGWPPDLADSEILARLLELNLEREPAPQKGTSS